MGLKLNFSAMIAKPPVDDTILKHVVWTLFNRVLFLCDLVEFFER